MNKIKYDKRDNKVLFISSIVFSVLALIYFVILKQEQFLERYVKIMSIDGFWPSFFALCLIASAMWVKYIDSVFYLKRLEKHAYKVPKNKKDYSNNLECLVKLEDRAQVQACAKESVVLAVITALIGIGVLITGIVYVVRYYQWINSVSFFVFCMFALAVLWFVGAFVYFRQRLTKKYKDDVETDQRKVRQNIVGGMVTIVLSFIITGFFMKTCYDLTEYFFR